MIALLAIWFVAIQIMGIVAWTTLYWMLWAWRRPETAATTAFADVNGDPTQYSFSLIVPAREEEAVLEATLEQLMELEHPDFEVVCVVGDDDDETRRIAREVAARYGERMQVVVDDSDPKNKARALNAALPVCRGEIIGVFDAEDVVHPDLLRRVDQTFQQSGSDVVQGGVQLMNYRSSWFAVRNVLEYYFWFRSRLHFHADAGFIPLGGNTVFVKKEQLERIGGWDPDALTEDCDLGTQLSAAGAKITVAYDPVLATREETPDTIGALARQRTRWNQGFLQVLRKGDWRGLPTGRRLLAGYTLALPIFQAIAAIMIPLALVLVFFTDTPVLITLLMFVPILPLITTVIVELVGLREFGREFGLPISDRDYLRVFFGTIPYWLILGYAAARAVVRELSGARNWEKTDHLGAHFDPEAVGRPTTLGSGDPAAAGIGADGPSARTGPIPVVATSADEEEPAPGERRRRTLPATVPAGAAAFVAAEPRRGGFLGIDTVVMALLVTVLGIISAWNMGVAPAFNDDEGTYVSNAWAVQNLGDLSHYTYWYDHPPLGWITISAWTWLTDAFDRGDAIAAGREVALIAHLISLALLWVVARRLGMQRWTAGLAVVVYALSPLALEQHRLIWIDNLAMPWALGALALALCGQCKVWSYAGSGACLAVACLTRETFLLLLPVIIYAAWRNADERNRSFALAVFGSFLGVILAGFLLFAALKGELFPGDDHVSLWDAVKFQLFERPTTGTLLDSESQAYFNVERWLDTDPWLLGLGVVLAPISLIVPRLRPVGIGLVVLIAFALMPVYLPIQYVIAVLPLAALSLAGAIDVLSGRQLGLAAIITLVLAVVIAPQWYDADRELLSSNNVTSHEQARDWLTVNVPDDAVIVTDDTYFVDLVEAGRPRENVIYFEKLEYDPGVKIDFPTPPVGIDYVVSSEAVRSNITSSPNTQAALDNAKPMAQFGVGGERVGIWKVTAPA